MIGFNINAFYTKTKPTKSTFPYINDLYDIQSEFSINPNYGFFIGKNSAIGFSLFYRYKKNKSNNFNYGYEVVDEDISNTIGASFFYRKYFTIVDKFSVGLDASTGFNWGLGKDRVSSSNDVSYHAYNYLSYSVGIAPTMIFFPHPQYGIEFSYGYIGYNYNQLVYDRSYYGTPNGTYNHDFKFNFGPSSLRLGFHYYMFKKSSSKTNK